MYRLLLIIWILLTLVYGVAKAQAPSLVDDHVTDSLERFDAMRVSPPLTITCFDGKRIEAVYAGAKGQRAYIFEADENSKLEWPKGFKPKEHRSDLYWIIYCNKNHSHSPDEYIFYPYVLTQVLPSQIKK